MRTLKLVLVLLTVLWSPLSLSGTGHSHAPVSAEKATEIATNIVSSLVKQGVIDPSWKKVEIANIEEKTFDGNKEWVASFNNPEIGEKEKQVLYIFLTLSGEYLAANYTGQ